MGSQRFLFKEEGSHKPYGLFILPLFRFFNS